jgi:hypothetical protein
MACQVPKSGKFLNFWEKYAAPRPSDAVSRGSAPGLIMFCREEKDDEICGRHFSLKKHRNACKYTDSMNDPSLPRYFSCRIENRVIYFSGPQGQLK